MEKSIHEKGRRSTDVTDPLIIPMIFIFLSCREKAYNKEFSC